MKSETNKKKKAVVFGLGNNFRMNYYVIMQHYDIIALSDNDAVKQGTCLYGLEVISPDNIRNMDYDIIIVTPDDSVKILRQLVTLDININDIVTWQEMSREEMHFKKSNQLYIGFYLLGGMGDYIIAANYIAYFRNKFENECMKINILCQENISFSDAIFMESEWNDSIFSENEIRYVEWERMYDLVIKLRRYPFVARENYSKIARLCPGLIDYIQLCKKFEIFYGKLIIDKVCNDAKGAVLSEIEGKKRIQQPDIYNYLQITEDAKYLILIKIFEMEYLKKLNLTPDKYITLHRGCDVKNPKDSTKLWKLEYYEQLIADIRRKYPQVKLIQLGVSISRCPSMKEVDHNLVGRTNMEQVKVLLKNSYLHIDNEGGMVHLRHALKGGKSIVLFGPTSDEFFGYKENINIRGNGCPHWCEWVTYDWQVKCIAGYEEPKCMESIVPQMVMKEVDKEMRNWGR